MDQTENKRAFEPDQAYCPNCKTQKWGFQHEKGVCKDCAADVRWRWPLSYYVKYMLFDITAKTIFVLLLVGPPLYAIYVAFFTSGPLIVFKQTTVTVPAITIESFVAPALVFWLLFLLVMYCATGGCPRP